MSSFKGRIPFELTANQLVTAGNSVLRFARQRKMRIERQRKLDEEHITLICVLALRKIRKETPGSHVRRMNIARLKREMLTRYKVSNPKIDQIIRDCEELGFIQKVPVQNTKRQKEPTITDKGFLLYTEIARDMAEVIVVGQDMLSAYGDMPREAVVKEHIGRLQAASELVDYARFLPRQD